MEYRIHTMIGDNDTHRYILASEGNKILIAIGVNPSTANESKPDPTVRKVMCFAERNKYDGFVMLNLYAQRATDFACVHKQMKEDLHQNNMQAIREYFKDYDEINVLAAWGNLIEQRSYLLQCCKDLTAALNEGKSKVKWYSIGELTKGGHPRHPLYAPYAMDLEEFDIENYVKD